MRVHAFGRVNALGRLRDLDRFGAWLAGIIRNISRAAARQTPLMLLADWPEDPSRITTRR